MEERGKRGKWEEEVCGEKGKGGKSEKEGKSGTGQDRRGEWRRGGKRKINGRGYEREESLS